MKPDPEYLVDSIFKKLKDYKTKEIFLEKDNLQKFIFSLFKENWTQGIIKKTCIIKLYPKKKDA